MAEPERRSRRGEFGRQMETRDPEALKKFYEMAAAGDESKGIEADPTIKPEDPDKAIREAARIAESAPKEKKAPESSGAGGFSGGFDETSAVPEAGEAIVTSQNRHLVPKIDRRLRQAGHRRIYGVHEAMRIHGDNATEDHVEEHAQIWDQMPDDSKALWQRGPGAKSTAAAIRNVPQLTKSGADTQRERNRNKVIAAALGTGDLEGGSGAITRQVTHADRQELVEKFKTSGVVTNAEGTPERDWKKGWLATDLNTGRSLTADSGIRKQAGQASLGTALHDDPQHHAGLGSHIEELASRASGNSSGGNLQGTQFDGIAEKHANAAREALTASAMAHSLGLKDMAISKFNEAAHHAGNLSETVHAGNSAESDKDFGVQEDHKRDYKISVNPKSAFGR